LAVCACAALSSLSQLAYADGKPSVESFFAEPAISDVIISPKGEHVAVLMKKSGGSGQVLVVRETANPQSGTIVASADGNDLIYHIQWINEDRLVFTVHASINDLYGGNEDVMAVGRDGQHISHLISGNYNHTQESTGSHIKSKILTWDYGFFSTVHDGSDDVIVEKFQWKEADPYHPDSAHLFRLNTRTMELKDIPIGKSPDRTRYWDLDGHDAPRIAYARIEGRCVVYYRSGTSETWDVLDNDDCHGESFHPVAFDGEDHLIVKKAYKGYAALYRYDLKSRQADAEPLLSLQGFDYTGSIEQDVTTDKILGIHYEADAASTAWFDPRFKDIQSKINALLPQTVNQVTCGWDCTKSPFVLVTASSDRQPKQFILYNVEKNSLIGLGGSHPDIKPSQMGLRDFYRFNARDGLSIPIYVTTPPGKPAQPLPTVVLVHGGPWIRGGQWEWDQEAQFLASRGYLVLQPEFRGSTGYGGKLYRAGWKQWGQGMQDDLVDAVQWAVREHNADPKRIGIMGASYGGYATLMGLIKNPETFRCGVEWAGVTDSGLMFSLAEGDFSDETKKYDLALLMGDPVKDAEMFKQYSPLENAAKLTQPLLMAHGADDKRVPVAQAAAFHSAVTKNNSHVEYVVYNNERHGWHLEKDNIDFWKRVDAFLDRNLMNAN
jgi:dienelactone hydrolase